MSKQPEWTVREGHTTQRNPGQEYEEHCQTFTVGRQILSQNLWAVDKNAALWCFPLLVNVTYDQNMHQNTTVATGENSGKQNQAMVCIQMKDIYIHYTGVWAHKPFLWWYL